jgi:hypothetical protein
MKGPDLSISQGELADFADWALEKSGDDAFRLADVLDGIEISSAQALITSDFLNAYQAWIWFFRSEPDDLARDRMMLEPASELVEGVLIGEVDLFEVVFVIRDGEGMIDVTDGVDILASFRGRDAPSLSREFIDENIGL